MARTSKETPSTLSQMRTELLAIALAVNDLVADIEKLLAGAELTEKKAELFSHSLRLIDGTMNRLRQDWYAYRDVRLKH